MADQTSIPNSLNLAFIESLYADYTRDPGTVPPEWRRYFEQALNGESTNGPVQLGPAFSSRSIFNSRRETARDGVVVVDQTSLAGFQDRVNQLIRNYRIAGHRIARIDPLNQPRSAPPELRPEFFAFQPEEMDRRVTCDTIQFDGALTVRELHERLRNTYCRSIGVEYMHISDMSVRRWLQKRMESTENRLELTRAEQLRILTRLTDAVTFEEFIRKKFVGAKSFSLEGCESLIPLLDLAIEKAAEQDIPEIVLGMAHRGRLNVLANIMGKSPRQIFREFAETDAQRFRGGGDVKYHLGYSGDWQASTGRKVHLSLTFNPSHLEFVNGVVLGRVRAKQDRVNDTEQTRCMALLIHGDAAFAGEGVVQETLNLSRLDGYSVGGTLHVIVNNQIGFTTSPSEGRSSAYATDVAKMLQSPIFHVNGEDPEAVAQVVRLAMDFRYEFKRDVFIDMYGYRRLGHNETDEPAFTQPVLYRMISKHKPVREGYLEHLLQLGGLTREEADRIAEERREHLERELSQSQSETYNAPNEGPRGIWSRSNFVGGPDSAVEEVGTGVPKERLSELLRKQTGLPADFHPHPKIKKLLEARLEMSEGKHPLDWGAGEALAFATLAAEGWRVRLSGQDSERGTFSHRHAVLHDHKDGHSHVPLQHLDPKQAPVEIYNSPLSEAGVLGFDYGYSLDCPDGLVMWEAQFGDFVNTAQVIIDQFLSSAEDKWRRLSGLVLLLPHGFEGAGPEHSSARVERFLSLAAEDNMQIVYPTTPAQYFHCLRRQLMRRWRKPLIVFTPKSLLRHPSATSAFAEFERGSFRRLIVSEEAPPNARRILLCSGKICFELEAKLAELKRNDVAIMRVEQLYPLSDETLKSALDRFEAGAGVMWVQEEPENMGAWPYFRARFGDRIFGRPFSGAFRAASASPATGYSSMHKKEQAQILAAACAGS
jgi:2-oxoglutarate dehydrogenase E1 component